MKDFYKVLLIGGGVWMLWRLMQRQSTTVPALPSPGVTMKADGNIKLLSWDQWMKTAPELVRASLEEGECTPEELVNNLMRRLYPKQTWPPQKGDKRFGVWSRMVESVARTLEQPHVPQLHVVS